MQEVLFAWGSKWLFLRAPPFLLNQAVSIVAFWYWVCQELGYAWVCCAIKWRRKWRSRKTQQPAGGFSTTARALCQFLRFLVSFWHDMWIIYGFAIELEGPLSDLYFKCGQFQWWFCWGPFCVVLMSEVLVNDRNWIYYDILLFEAF